jgi:hypothetical protein
MAVYVDDMRRHATVGNLRARWSHLMADTDDELHAFAARLGLRRSWAQYPGTPKSHYDLTDSVRRRALSLDAIPIGYGSEESVALIRRRRAAMAAVQDINPRARAELEAARAQWFTVLPCTQPPALSPHCADAGHVGCWHGHARPSYVSVRHAAARRQHGPRGYVATFRTGWSRYTETTSARIVIPADHYTCECSCHTDGYVGQQLDLFVEMRWT